jgi:diketogulonate reductase-like aldo/keto reductase
MGLEYFDLYLIHFPISQKFVPFETRYPPEWIHDPSGENPKIELNPVPYSETWAGMESLVDEGLVRNIGVANLVVHPSVPPLPSKRSTLLPQVQSLMDLLSYCRIKPVVNQVELHPYLTQQELLEYSQISSIHLTAFSPLGSSSYVELGMDYGRNIGALQEEIVQELARKYSRTPAQIILRWGVQRGVSVIPKSSRVERVVENMNIFNFELSAEDMERVSGLNCNLRFNNPGVFCKFMGGSIPIFG